ncbi:hypothetical protein RRG08_033964 [Elysia crispata]|uniref:LITAF domain-containing protein n=1 Tax=Elysia crispata TaxID=231223 RepID=A0AAE0YSY6_9GAST|nr:hypothetical protein RRG08_033964 [Elysia crispata]
MSTYPDAPPPKYEPPAAGFHNPDQPPMAGYPPPGPYPPQPTAGYPPGQYPPPQHHGHATVVVTQPVVAPINGSVMCFGQSPALIVCPHCQATVTTSTDYTTGLMTWLLAGGVCIVGCWLGCCLVPFCIDAGKDVVHTCPNCKRQVGMFKQIH